MKKLLFILTFALITTFSFSQRSLSDIKHDVYVEYACKIGDNIKLRVVDKNKYVKFKVDSILYFDENSKFSTQTTKEYFNIKYATQVFFSRNNKVYTIRPIHVIYIEELDGGKATICFDRKNNKLVVK